MTSSIQYKFRTQNVNKTLSFDGPSITAIELKRAICNAENIKTELFDLVFVDSFSKKPYSGDDPILRNSSVTVVRVPVENGAKLPKISNPEISGVAQSDNISDNATHISSEEYEKMTETERLKHAMHQSTYKYSTNNYKKKVNPSSQTVQAPPDYLCHRCNQLGHFPKACPLLNVRRTTGIPNEELMETTPDDPQAMLHPSGRFVIPIMHYKAREARRLQEEQRKLGILPTDSKSKQEKKEDPPHLKCPLCNNLFNDAVTAVCCGQNFCSDCIQQKMIDAGIADVPFQCPMCNKHIGDKELQENMTLREDVSKYKKSLLNPLTIQTPIDVSSELSIKPKVRKVQNLIIRPIIPFQPEIAEVTETSDTTNTIPVEPVKLPTVNLSAMFAPKPQPAPPIVHVVNSLPIPEIPDLTKPPPLVVDSLTLAHPIIDQTNFKFNETAIPSVPPKTNVSTKKNIIRNIELDDRDQAAIDKVWEKLAVADDDIDLATLFDDPKPSPKTEKKSRSRSPVRSQSHDKSKRRSPKRDRRDGKDDRRYDVDKERRKDKLKKDDIRDSGRSKERTSEASSRRHWDEKTRKDLQIKDETVKTLEKEPKIERELNQKSKTIETNNEEKTDLKELEKIDKNGTKKDLKIESKEERRESKEKRREIKKDERRREKELRKESRDDRRFEKELDRKDKREKLEKKIEDSGRENEEKSRKRDSRGERKEVELEKSKNNVKKEDENKPRIDEKNERKHLENDETERREKRRREKDERNQEKEDRRESKKKAESEKNEVRQESRADDSRKEVNQDFDKNKRFQSLKDEEPAVKKLRTDSSVGKTNGSYVIDSVESTLKYPEKTNNERDEKAADVSKRSHRSSSHKKKHKKSKSEDREKKKKKKRKHDFDGEDDERSKKKRRRHDSNDDKSEQKSRRHHKDKKKKRDRKSRRRSNSDDDRRVEVS